MYSFCIFLFFISEKTRPFTFKIAGRTSNHINVNSGRFITVDFDFYILYQRQYTSAERPELGYRNVNNYVYSLVILCRHLILKDIRQDLKIF